MSQGAKGGLAKLAGVTMGLILISRLLGFLRDRAAAEVFGRSVATDAFRIAFNIPDLMYFLLVGGAIGAAFIPVFSEYLATNREREGWEMASTFINGTIVLLMAATILGMIFTPALTPLVAAEFHGEDRELLIQLMRLMFPAVFFTALAGLQMGILNSYREFRAPLIGPIIYNLGIIFGAYYLGPRIGIQGMAVGTVLGAIANFAFQVPFVLRRNAGYRLGFDLSHPDVGRLVHLMIPAVVAFSIFQVNLIIGSNLASGLVEGSVTALNLANRLMQLPLGVFAMGMSTVLFPTLARQAARQEVHEFVQTFSRGVRLVFFLTIPSSVGLMVLGVSIVRLLFEAGAFGPDDTVATAAALSFYSVGLVSQSGIQILTRVFYSLQDTTKPVIVGLLTIVLNTGLSLIFLKVTNLGHAGLALAFSITSLVNLLVYLVMLRHRLGRVNGWNMLRTIGFSTASAAVMGVAVWAVHAALTPRLNLDTILGRLIDVTVPLSLGLLVYGVLTWLLRMDEAREASGLILRRLQGRRKPELPGSDGTL